MKKDRRFAHWHNGFFLFMLTGVLIAACVPLIIMSFEKGGYYILWLALYGAVFAFLVWLLIVRRKYVFKDDCLTVVTGPVSRKYLYEGITRIRYRKGTRFRCPGFIIFYMGREKITVQPLKTEEFAEEIKKRCPGAEYEL